MADHGCRIGSGRGGIGPGHGGHGSQVGGSGCRFGPQSGSFYGPYFDHRHAFQHGPHQYGFAQGPHQHSVQHGPYKHGDHHGPHHQVHHHGVHHGPHQHGDYQGPHQHGVHHGPHQHGDHHGPHHQVDHHGSHHHGDYHGSHHHGDYHGSHHHGDYHGPHQHGVHHGLHHHGVHHGLHHHGVHHGPHQHSDHHGPHQHGFPHGQHQQSHFLNRPNFEDIHDNGPDCVNEIFDHEYDHQCHRGHCKKDMKHKHHHFHHSKKVHKNSLDPVLTIVEKKNGKFTIRVVLCKETKPEDLKLNVRERDIYIEIKMEKQSEDGTSRLSQVFTKKVALPEEVEVEEIKSTFTSEHVLKIEASIPISEEIVIPVVVDEED